MKNIWTQVAIDVDDIDQAKDIAHTISQCGSEWIEVGTPLLFKYGYSAISILRDAIPDNIKLVADYKYGFAYHFIKQVSENGASFITVNDGYDDDLVARNLESAYRHNIDIIFSLLEINPQNLIERATRLQQLGAQYLMVRRFRYYRGIKYNCIRDLRSKVGIQIGVTDDELDSALQCANDGADWLIFGKIAKNNNKMHIANWIDNIHLFRDVDIKGK